MRTKFELLRSCYLNIYFNLLIPIGVAAFYLGILPYVSLGFDLLSEYAFKRRKEISHDRDIQEMKREYDFDIEELKKRSEKEAEERIQSRARGSKPESDKEKQDGILPDEESKETETTSKSGVKAKSNRKTADKQKKTNAKFTISDADKLTTKTSASKHPVLMDVVMKGLPKSESEWVLVYALYSSDFGKTSFTLTDIRRMYKESKRHTASRYRNAGNNMKTLVKNDLVSYLNEKEMILREDGKQLAISILYR